MKTFKVGILSHLGIGHSISRNTVHIMVCIPLCNYCTLTFKFHSFFLIFLHFIMSRLTSKCIIPVAQLNTKPQVLELYVLCRKCNGNMTHKCIHPCINSHHKRKERWPEIFTISVITHVWHTFTKWLMLVWVLGL